MMSRIKRNYGWILVTILSSLPLLVVSKMINFDFDNGILFSDSSVDQGRSTIEMLYHVTGEFAIRWMTAVLTLTPVFIIFGVNNLFVRQAMGIATAVWSLLHFILFIAAEGWLETTTQFNYIAGFIAVLMLTPLLVTSNRKSMKFLKGKWKKLQSLAYPIIFLSLLHVAILDKTWMIYAIVVGLGFVIRIPQVKAFFIERRNQKL